MSHPYGPRIVPGEYVLSSPKYLALRYVWGSSQDHILTRSTVAEKCSGLDTLRLSRTILDAMKITLRLRYNYLCVDSLCIFQGDPGHDGGELASMGWIYRNSEVTIIAANAASLMDGFLREAEPLDFLVDPFSIPLTTLDGTVRDLTLVYRSHYNNSLYNRCVLLNQE